jgi:hypothetical protein
LPGFRNPYTSEFTPEPPSVITVIVVSDSQRLTSTSIADVEVTWIRRYPLATVVMLQYWYFELSLMPIPETLLPGEIAVAEAAL